MQMQHPTSRHVLLVGNGTLLAAGVESLLTCEPGLQISGITYTDEAAFLRDIRREQPEVVLLNEAGSLDAARILALLPRILAQVHLRVIVVRQDDNTVDVYEKRRVIATRREDLAALVRYGTRGHDSQPHSKKT